MNSIDDCIYTLFFDMFSPISCTSFYKLYQSHWNKNSKIDQDGAPKVNGLSSSDLIHEL